MSNSISVIIPVYNSENSINRLYNKLKKFLSNNFSQYEIIMVDDNSSDNSFLKMVNLNKKDDNIKVIKLRENFGQQNALMCGLEYAKGDYIVTIDDDLQHSPSDIINLYNEIKKGYDVVYGIPIKRNEIFYRRVGSYLTDKVFNLITRKSSNIRVSSFRIFNKKILNQLKKCDSSFVYLSAIILKITKNIDNIPVKRKKRFDGDSNYNIYKLIKLFVKLYIYYSDNRLTKLFRANKPQYIIEKKYGFNG